MSVNDSIGSAVCITFGQQLRRLCFRDAFDLLESLLGAVEMLVGGIILIMASAYVNAIDSTV